MNADKQIEKITTALTEYSAEVETMLETNKQKVAKEVLTSLKNNSNIPSRTGNYKKSFYQKKIKTNSGFTYLIANKKYMLTHLLEYGHSIVKNKTVVAKTRAFPHWKKAQEVADELFKDVSEGIKKL